MKIYKHGTFWCIINLGNKHTKEGAMNEKLELRKLLIYAISVYRIPQKIKGMTDKKEKKRDPVLQPYHASFYGPAFAVRKLPYVFQCS